MAVLTGCRSSHIQFNPVLISWHTRKSEKDRACGRRGKGGEEEAKYGVEEMRRWRKREKGREGERKREREGGRGDGGALLRQGVV